MNPPHVASALALLTGLGALSCASTASTGAEEARPKTGGGAGEIVRLRTRGGDVAVLTGSGASRVAIYDPSGAFVRTAAVESLRASDPDLYEILTTATATSGPYLDARLDVAAPPRDEARAPR